MSLPSARRNPGRRILRLPSRPKEQTTMKNANPYLNFDGNAREAFDHYRSVFGGEFVTAMTFREFGGEQMGLAGAMLDRIAHIALPLGSSLLMASDVTRPGDFKVGTHTYVAVETDVADAADRVFPVDRKGTSMNSRH